MRIVLDTNVLIAALIADGVCARLLEHCTERHEIVLSDFILAETRRHLAEKFRFDQVEVDEAIRLLESSGTLVAPAELGKTVSRDRDDDLILGTAVAGRADCIVTGDEDLLVLREFRGIPSAAPVRRFRGYKGLEPPWAAFGLNSSFQNDRDSTLPGRAYRSEAGRLWYNGHRETPWL